MAVDRLLRPHLGRPPRPLRPPPLPEQRRRPGLAREESGDQRGILLPRHRRCVRLNYRVTIQVVPNLLLTSKLLLHFSICYLY